MISFIALCCMSILTLTVYIYVTRRAVSLSPGLRVLVFVIGLVAGGVCLSKVYKATESGEIDCRSSRGSFTTCFRASDPMGFKIMLIFFFAGGVCSASGGIAVLIYPNE